MTLISSKCLDLLFEYRKTSLERIACDIMSVGPSFPGKLKLSKKTSIFQLKLTVTGLR